MQTNDSTNRKSKQAEPCPTCGGKGYTRIVWHTDDGSPAYVLRPDCPDCKGSANGSTHS
jgi:DnaJ-class molecular chaperone